MTLTVYNAVINFLFYVFNMTTIAMTTGTLMVQNLNMDVLFIVTKNLKK